MEYNFSSRLTYIPKWDDNRGRTEDEKIVVTYKNPTVSMKNKLVRKPELKFQYDKDGNVLGGETTVTMDRKTVIDGMDIRIDNLEYSLDGDKKKVQSSRDLWNAPSAFDPLIDELAEFFKEELERRVNEKN